MPCEGRRSKPVQNAEAGEGWRRSFGVVDVTCMRRCFWRGTWGDLILPGTRVRLNKGARPGLSYSVLLLTGDTQ